MEQSNAVGYKSETIDFSRMPTALKQQEVWARQHAIEEAAKQGTGDIGVYQSYTHVMGHPPTILPAGFKVTGAVIDTTQRVAKGKWWLDPHSGAAIMGQQQGLSQPCYRWVVEPIKARQTELDLTVKPSAPRTMNPTPKGKIRWTWQDDLKGWASRRRDEKLYKLTDLARKTGWSTNGLSNLAKRGQIPGRFLRRYSAYAYNMIATRMVLAGWCLKKYGNPVQEAPDGKA